MTIGCRGIPALLLAVGFLSTGAVAQERPLWGSLESGPNEVGFQRIWRLDPSRVWERSAALRSSTGDIARPIRIDVWYPASCGDRARARFGEYVALHPPSEAFRDMSQLLATYDRRSYRNLTGERQYDSLMRAPTGVCAEGDPAGGRFPVVVYSAGWYSRSPDNTVLAEYLASHGFVVATVPQLNPGLWTSDFRSTPAAVETQIRDLEYALGVLLDEPYVDRTRVAAMGYSTGGDIALLLQGRNPLVRAVVGLDPSFALGAEAEIVASPYFDLQQIRGPILTIRRPATDGRVDLPIALDSLALAQRLLVSLPSSDHGTFGDDPPVLAYLGTGESEKLEGHTTVARVVRAFLQQVLGTVPSMMTREEARQWIGHRARFLFRDAAPIPDADGWERFVIDHGHVEAARRAKELHEAFPTLVIVQERDLNSLGYRRLRDGEPARAVSLFRFNALVHSESANVFDSLADGCQALADTTCVVAAYRELLRALPGDRTLPPAVKRRMRETAERALRGTGTPP